MGPVTLNPEQKLYVIPCDGGYSCFGFDNARDHVNQIAQRIGRPELAFTPEDYATLGGYSRYQQAVRAWGESPMSRQTYFDPGTASGVAHALEAGRKSGHKVRLVLGDTVSGETWLDEYDVVGTIGRSGGTLKVPLLVEAGECGGAAILTACVLSVIDWRTGRTMYRHAAYRLPDLGIQPTGDSAQPWAVLRSGEAIARFADIGKAGAYLAFMRGETVEPRVFR